MRPRQPLERRPGCPRCSARGRGTRLESLDPHPRWLLQGDAQPQRRLVLPDGAGSRACRSLSRLAARQGPRRLLVAEWAAVCARPARGLRPLAPDGQRRLVGGGRPALLQESRGSGARRRRLSRHRRPTARFEHAPPAPYLRRLGGFGPGGRLPLQSGLQRRQSGGRGLLPAHRKERTALQCRRCLSASRAQAPQSHRRHQRTGSSPGLRGSAGHGRGLSRPRRSRTAGPGARRDRSLVWCDRLAADPDAFRDRRGRRDRVARHRPASRPAGRRQEPSGPSAGATGLQMQRTDAERRGA